MKNRSTINAIYELLNLITNAINKDEKTCAVFVDMAKAFDTVPHERLLVKLEKYGIRGNAQNLFSNYLNNRVQKVKIGGEFSNPLTVKIGIPQGTVLGPICFLLYMNDMFDLGMGGHVISYADDTVVVFKADSNENLQNMVEQGLQQLKTWLEINLLSMNVNKTNFIHFTLTTDLTVPNILKIHNLDCNQNTNCNCNEIERVNSTKYLGVITDENLKWKEHIIYLYNKLRKILPKFYQIRNIAREEIKRTLYYGLVKSNLRYGIIVWGSAYDNAIRPLEIIQKTLIKILYTKDRYYPSDQLFKETKLMTIRQIYCFESLNFIHLHSSCFETITANYNTRVQTNKQFKLPKPNKSHYKRTIFYLGLKMYNELPHELKNNQSLNKYKLQLKRHILINSGVYNTID